jgi:serine protease inhibitor
MPTINHKTHIAGAAALVLAMCTLTKQTNQLSAAESPSTQANYAVTADNDFAVDLYRQLAKEMPGKNLFFSPYSMLSALAMSAEGARGETALQMGKALCFPADVRRAGKHETLPWNMSVIHAGMSLLNERYNRKPASKELLDKIAALRKELDESKRLGEKAMAAQDWQKYSQESRKSLDLAGQLNSLLAQVNQYELRVANALWAEKTYPFAPAYLETIHKFYKTGGAFPADFKGNPEGERQKINAWVEEQTKGRIRNLIPPGSIDDLTRLVLTNAIYFKGEWAAPFSAEATKEEDFLAAGEKVRVPMMHKNDLDGARYGAFNSDGSPFATPRTIPRGEQSEETKNLYPGKGGFLAAELPYKGGELSMLVTVPQDPDGLAALEEKLTSKNIAACIGKLEDRKISVELPKFKLETEYAMNGALKALGMVRAFEAPSPASGAQFDGMCASQDPANKLYIAYVAHKAFVEVNEKGTEAAAATGVVMRAAAARVSVPFVPTFRADRPFVFAIRDLKAGTILFLGRLNSPTG